MRGVVRSIAEELIEKLSLKCEDKNESLTKLINNVLEQHLPLEIPNSISGDRVPSSRHNHLSDITVRHNVSDLLRIYQTRRLQDYPPCHCENFPFLPLWRGLWNKVRKGELRNVKNDILNMYLDVKLKKPLVFESDTEEDDTIHNTSTDSPGGLFTSIMNKDTITTIKGFVMDKSNTIEKEQNKSFNISVVFPLLKDGQLENNWNFDSDDEDDDSLGLDENTLLTSRYDNDVDDLKSSSFFHMSKNKSKESNYQYKSRIRCKLLLSNDGWMIIERRSETENEDVTVSSWFERIKGIPFPKGPPPIWLPPTFNPRTEYPVWYLPHASIRKLITFDQCKTAIFIETCGPNVIVPHSLYGGSLLDRSHIDTSPVTTPKCLLITLSTGEECNQLIQTIQQVCRNERAMNSCPAMSITNNDVFPEIVSVSNGTVIIPTTGDGGVLAFDIIDETRILMLKVPSEAKVYRELSNILLSKDRVPPGRIPWGIHPVGLFLTSMDFDTYKSKNDSGMNIGLRSIVTSILRNGLKGDDSNDKNIIHWAYRWCALRYETSGVPLSHIYDACGDVVINGTEGEIIPQLRTDFKNNAWIDLYDLTGNDDFSSRRSLCISLEWIQEVSPIDHTYQLNNNKIKGDKIKNLFIVGIKLQPKFDLIAKDGVKARGIAPGNYGYILLLLFSSAGMRGRFITKMHSLMRDLGRVRVDPILKDVHTN